MHDLHYNVSPFGAVYYAELEMARTGSEPHTHQKEWTPPEDDPDEICFYSDGAWDPTTGTGAAVAYGDHSFHSNKNISIPICSSSYSAELHGLELATEEAIEENICNSSISFILDCASILTGIKNWCFKHMNQQEIRILRNKANKV
jgi:ribonuclease HI